MCIRDRALGGKLYSVANRTYDKGVAFAEKYGIEKVYKEIYQVFEDPEVDIIYISTPHNTHINFLRKALAAGKHVLCEKSITLNSEELAEAIQLAEENHVKLAEAMTIFHMPSLLYTSPERVFSKTELYEKVWQEDYVDDTNTLNVHIHALRQELTKYTNSNAPAIKTVWGLGYKMEKPRGRK